jgi:hypothetical protein
MIEEKLKLQVCSLELSKKLSELNIKSESLLFWIKHANYKVGWILAMDGGFNRKYHSESISAFTASELLELLPNLVNVKGHEPFDNYRIIINKFYCVDERNVMTNNFIVNYECDTSEIAGENAWNSRKLTNSKYDPNLSNACAKMLIYLLENKLIELPTL